MTNENIIMTDPYQNESEEADEEEIRRNLEAQRRQAIASGLEAQRRQARQNAFRTSLELDSSARNQATAARAKQGQKFSQPLVRQGENSPTQSASQPDQLETPEEEEQAGSTLDQLKRSAAQVAKDKAKQVIKKAAAQAVKKLIASLLANPYFWLVVGIILGVILLIVVICAVIGYFEENPFESLQVMGQATGNEFLEYIGAGLHAVTGK